jgi:acetyltransferase
MERRSFFGEAWHIWICNSRYDDQTWSAPVSIYRLDRVFAPGSVALVGASEKRHSLGAAVLSNLCKHGFQGSIYPVNPRYQTLAGLTCYPSLLTLPTGPDVAVLVVPAAVVPEVVAQAAAIGTSAVIILSGGLGTGKGSTAAAVAQTARAAGLRIIGPNCLGIIAPHASFDASFAAQATAPGRLALISQSGAVAAAMLEWARGHNAGFSGVVSLGDELDVDFADCLDYFAQDRATRAILLYMESLSDARKFMSAARAAARTKPVIVVKSARYCREKDRPQSHSKALAQTDGVYDAAFRRAGLLRVYDLEELFAAAESLTRASPFQGERVAILTNGLGIGLLAADRIADLKGRPAEPSESTLQLIGAAGNGCGKHLIDLGGDASAPRYVAATEALLADGGTDALLVINCPSALASSDETALAIAENVKRARAGLPGGKPVFAAWLDQSKAATTAFEAASIPYYGTEAAAVGGLMHLVDYRRAQQELMKAPPSLPENFVPDVRLAKQTIARAIVERRQWLGAAEMLTILSAYAIAIAPVQVAKSAEAAGELAATFIAQGSAVAIKILSEQIIHKSEVGGVALDLASPAEVVANARHILDRVGKLCPDAIIDGLTVQPMIHRARGIELIAGIADDPVFGPVVVFGRGGTAVETIDDKALALPPLDLRLAEELIERTRVYRRLSRDIGDRPALDAVALTLVKLAQLSADIPEICELDLNPIIADGEGAIVLDARARITPVDVAMRLSCNPRFAIKPYPKELECSLTLRDGKMVRVRPIRPEDEALYEDFFAAVTEEDLRLRFFAPIRDRGHALIARLTQIDYARAMALAAIEPETGKLLGVVRLHLDADRVEGEYAILLRSALKGRGLGWELMRLIIDYAKREGVQKISGQVLTENTTMLAMCEKLGFSFAHDPDDWGVTVATLALGTEAVVGSETA